jgi:hypothetical protein
LDPKYFTLWKRKLREPQGSGETSEPAANKVNPLTYLTCVLANARNKSIMLPTPDEFTASNIG